MSTRSIVATEEQRLVMMRLVSHEWQDADERRMTIPEWRTDQTKEALRYQLVLEDLQQKLRGE